MIDDALKSQSNIEGFLALAKNARGAAAQQLVHQVTEAPGVFVFGEIAQFPGIKQLETDFPREWKLLELFAFGTYREYLNDKSSYPELSELQICKLRHLSVVSLASNSKHVSYDLLKKELALNSLRELEDLIIETIYAGILKGKLDQRENQLEVEFVIARDIKPNTIDTVLSTLGEWCNNCDSALSSLQAQILRANDGMEVKQAAKKKMEAEIEQVKSALKAQSQEINEEDLEASSSTGMASQQSSKQPKIKGFKSASKPSTSRTRLV